MKTMRVNWRSGGLAVALLAGGGGGIGGCPQGSTTFSAVGSDSGLGNGSAPGPLARGWAGAAPARAARRGRPAAACWRG